MDYLVKLWKHQLDAIYRAANLDEYALFFEPGCGKSATCINLLRYKYLKHNKVLRTLILCPPIVIENWRREFKLHSHVADKVICLSGPGKKRVELLEKNFEENRIIVTNFESLLMKDLFNLLLRYAPTCLVVDESQRIKSMQSKRTKAAIQLADISKYRYILSGTPVLNSPMDLFSQFRVLDKGVTFGKNLFLFRAKYFYDKNALMPKNRYFPDWQIKPNALEEINSLIAKKSMRALKRECLDLPDLVVKNIYVDLAKDQLRIYNEMKRDLIAVVNDRACTAQLAITKALRLLQITSGFLTVDGENGSEREAVSLTENPKMDALKELLETLTPYHKLIIWACYSKEYQGIRKLLSDLSISSGEVTGEVSQKEKDESLLRFAEDESCRVLLSNPCAGGVGVNITSASYAIFFSRTFSLEHYLQAQARNYRGGSERFEKITHINLVAKDTIDEKVLLALADKESVSDKILSFVKEI